MMTDIQRRQKIWEEILEEARNQSTDRTDGEITVKEFAIETGIGIDKARDFLNEKVIRGIMKVRKTKSIHYYSLVD